MVNKKIKWLFYVFLFFLILRSIGWLLDKEVERAIHQEYARNKDGIIKIAEPKSYQNNHDKALVLLMGHMDTPQKFYEIYEMAKKENSFDVYVPNFPFHSKTIEIGKNLDNKIVQDYIENFVADLSSKYKQVTVVALSYSGLIMANLLSKNKIPLNINSILYSPAIYMKNNTFLNYWATYLLPRFFREYYNYDFSPLLPTGFPVYESGDTKARSMLETEIGFRYRIFRALRTLFELDRETVGVLTKINRPFKILMAKDDNRIPYDKIKEKCDNNKYCEFISFPSGKHIIHFGFLKNKFYEIISKNAQI